VPLSPSTTESEEIFGKASNNNQKGDGDWTSGAVLVAAMRSRKQTESPRLDNKNKARCDRTEKNGKFN
jgi:hypothetical protein